MQKVTASDSIAKMNFLICVQPEHRQDFPDPKIDTFGKRLDL